MAKNKKQLPLSGKTVVVTRPKPQNREMTSMLKKLGARTLEFPMIEIRPPKSWKALDRAVRDLDGFDWVILNSVHGAEAFASRLKRASKTRADLKRLKIACVGPKTASVIRKWKRPDLVPGEHTSEGLLRALKKRERLNGIKILVPRTDIAPKTFADGLCRLGAKVTEAAAYRTVRPAKSKRSLMLKRLLGPEAPDFITFTSASTVKHFFEMITRTQRKKIRCKPVTIGPVTSAALRAEGLRPFREAGIHTAAGLVRALAAI